MSTVVDSVFQFTKIRSRDKGQRNDPHRWQGAAAQNSFNGLPAEIKAMVLCASFGVTNLRALVKTSPAYHAVYLDRRRSILCTVLTTSVGLSGLVKSLAALSAREIGHGEKWSKRCKAFLNTYTDNLRSFSHDSISLEDLILISRLEFDLQVATKEFCFARLSRHPLSRETIVFDITNLSQNEYRRIRRGFLHFDVCTALTGRPTPEGLAFNVPMGWTQILRPFMETLEVWESEELQSIYDFVMFYYDRIFKQDRKPIRKIWSGVAFGPIRNNLRTAPHNALKVWETNLTSCGFQLFANVCKASSAASRVKLIEPCLKTDIHMSQFVYPPSYNQLGTFLGQRSITRFSQDQIQRGKETSFTFDEDEHGPNSAWTWAIPQHLWRRHHAWGNEYLRSWGYVMWDKSRLLDLGILQRDPTEYQSIHGPYEPGEPLLSECPCICRTTRGWNTLRKPKNGHNISQCKY